MAEMNWYLRRASHVHIGRKEFLTDRQIVASVCHEITCRKNIEVIVNKT